MTAASDTPSPRRDDAEEWVGTRPSEHCLIRIPAEATGGTFSLIEILSDPGDEGTSLHVHSREDEHFVILEGTARVAYGDRVFDAAPGMSLTLVRGVPHAWRNASATAPLRMLVTCTPGGVEEVFRIAARGGEIDLPALGARFGVEVLGPMPEG